MGLSSLTWVCVFCSSQTWWFWGLEGSRSAWDTVPGVSAAGDGPGLLHVHTLCSPWKLPGNARVLDSVEGSRTGAGSSAGPRGL